MMLDQAKSGRVLGRFLAMMAMAFVLAFASCGTA